MSIINLSTEELQNHVQRVAGDNLMAQVSPETMREALQGMKDVLGKSGQQPELGGRSR